MAPSSVNLLSIALLFLFLITPTHQRGINGSLEIIPLARTCAHNDEMREEGPLLSALENGICAVEADVHLMDGELVIGHNCGPFIKCNQTLMEFYVTPLLERFEQYSEIYQGAKKLKLCDEFILMIDVKTLAKPTYEALHELFGQINAQSPGFLTVYTNEKKISKGAMTVLLSGNRVSPDYIIDQQERFIVLDGRINDNMEDDYNHEVMPWISQAWTSVFDSTEVPFSEETKQKLKEITQKAHSRGQQIRFWATPETEEFWSELLDNGVDLINTDYYIKVRNFLLS